MWPEAIVAALGGLGASAAYVAHKARNYSGGWDASDVDRVNRWRGTETPQWNSPDFNRYGDAPGGYQPPALPPRPAWYDAVGAPPPVADWGRFYQRQDEERAAGTNPYGWLNGDPKPSPAHDDSTDPPPYDGPRGS